VSRIVKRRIQSQFKADIFEAQSHDFFVFELSSKTLLKDPILEILVM